MSNNLKSKLFYILTNMVMILACYFFVDWYTTTNDPIKINDVKPSEVIKGIDQKEKVVEYHTTEVINQKEIIRQLKGTIDDHFKKLEAVKAKRDTFMIVQIQDTLINTLLRENTHWRSVADNQDSIIIAQRYIINAKDTLISLQANQLTKTKRQRNIAYLFNALQTGIIVLKK